MKITSKNIVLKKYIPTGTPVKDDFNIREITLSLKNNHEVLIKNLWISVDPYMRTRMTDRKNYILPFKINEPMEGSAIGKVLESNSELFSKGDFVESMYGWRDSYIAKENEIRKIYPINVPIQTTWKGKVYFLRLLRLTSLMTIYGLNTGGRKKRLWSYS